MVEKLQAENYITSNNLARYADVVFSEALPTKLFQDLHINNVKVAKKSNEKITLYRLTNFRLKDGDVVFVHSGSIKLLFQYLKKEKNLKNIILLSHQADYPIEQKLFKTKPNSISKWFAINTDYDNKDLIPIPLGIANNYTTNNLLPSHFEKLNILGKKEEKLYINLVKSTNYKEREVALKYFEDLDWAIVKEPTLTLEEYANDLNKYKFVFCPWGNGYDTHRFWETLYSGSIPVTKYHSTYKNLEGLPVIFYDEINDINIDFLKTKANELNFENLNKLKIQYWVDEINKFKKEEPGNTYEIKEDWFIEIKFKFKSILFSFFEKNLKKARFYTQKIKKFIKV